MFCGCARACVRACVRVCVCAAAVLCMLCKGRYVVPNNAYVIGDPRVSCLACGAGSCGRARGVPAPALPAVCQMARELRHRKDMRRIDLPTMPPGPQDMDRAPLATGKPVHDDVRLL